MKKLLILAFLFAAIASKAQVGDLYKKPVYLTKDTGRGISNVITGGTLNKVRDSVIGVLNTGLATKQATLVSGTNIKTFNGATMLGSGDLGAEATVNKNAANGYAGLNSSTKIPIAIVDTPHSGTGLVTWQGLLSQNYGTGAGGVSSFNSRTGAVVPTTNDYTWAQVNKTTSSFADITTRSATDISSGTLADARLSANVPLLNTVNTFTQNQVVTGSSIVTGAASQLQFNRRDNNAGGGAWYSLAGEQSLYSYATSAAVLVVSTTGRVSIPGKLTISDTTTAAAIAYDKIATPHSTIRNERLVPYTLVDSMLTKRIGDSLSNLGTAHPFDLKLQASGPLKSNLAHDSLLFIPDSLVAGSIAISKLAITGTPNGTKFLRDDGSWQTIAAGGSAVGGDHALQYDSAGVFSGNFSKFYIDYAAGRLGINIVPASPYSLDVNGGIRAFNRTLFNIAPSGSSASSSLEVGGGGWTGGGSDFSGHAGGTTIGINEGSPYTADFINAQVAGVSKWRVGTTTGGYMSLGTTAVTANFNLGATATATGNLPLAIFTGAAHTNQTLSTELTDINFNLARTVQFATGALTTQRAMRIQAPTYSFVGASTITTASTVSISGAPAAGTNATITTAYALNVENGTVNVGNGNLLVPSGVVKPLLHGSTAATQAAASSFSMNLTTGNFLTVTLGASITSMTITSTAIATGEYFIYFVQDGTGGKTVGGWPASVKWPSGSAPTITSAANKTDIIRLVYDGTNYWGSIVGQNY